MAKGLRSKTKRRYRRCKRIYIEKNIITDQVHERYVNIKRKILGFPLHSDKPPNAFLYPNNPEAIIPQRKITTPIDFRPENLVLSGFAFPGTRKKLTNQEKIQLGLTLPSMDGPLELHGDENELDLSNLKMHIDSQSDNSCHLNSQIEHIVIKQEYEPLDVIQTFNNMELTDQIQKSNELNTYHFNTIPIVQNKLSSRPSSKNNK